MAILRTLLLAPLLLAPAAAQHVLFTTSQSETTLSGSAGTVLKDLRVDEVAWIDFANCLNQSAEKWAARTTYLTMAGDENNDGSYWNPSPFGKIDALVHLYLPGQVPSPRTVFFSVTIPMGTAQSGTPGLRPGDTGRIVPANNAFGQVQTFLSAEQVQSALGMPISPVVVDVDAIAADFGSGIFFSLDQDHVVSTVCGTTFVRDGDVIMIPNSQITWTNDLRVQSLVPACAVVVWTEAQIDQLVQNANLADRNGQCVTSAIDLETLDLDLNGRIVPFAYCNGVVQLPALHFSTETMTGGGMVTTDNGGQISQRNCGPIGTPCSSGPTLGSQIGLLPTSQTQGIPSYVDAMDTVFFTERFLIEPKQHVIPVGSPAVLDVHSPLAFTLMAVEVVGPGIAPHVMITPPILVFSDLYILGNPPWTTWWLGPGFSTQTTPNVPVQAKLVFQAGGFVNGNLVLSAPATVDVQ